MFYGAPMARKGKKNAARTAKQSQGNSLPKAHAKMLKAIDQEMEAGQLENALKYAEKLTADNPSLPAAWEKLSNIYAKSERARDAVEAYKKCIMCLGTSTEATELKLSQYEIMAGWGSQAIDRLSELCNKNPKNKKNWQHLSRAYHEIGKNQEALSANDKAYALDPEDDGVLMLRCRVLDQMQQVSEAKNIALKLKKIAPGKINVSNYLGSLELREGNYIVAEKHFSDEMEVAESSIAAYNRFISWHYNPEVPIATFKEEALKWYERFKADKQVSRASTLSQINKKIKIGLLSGGFRTHPVGQMIYPALENINQAECDLIVFSTHQAEDGLTTKIKSAVGQWHSVSGMSDIELDRFIRDCDIDILIDMNGGGEGSRFRMLTHEPAPIIVKWVGILINTTGLECIDYLLSDKVETPEGVDENYTEKLIRLPNDYICYHIPDYTPQVNELPAKTNGYITFGCLNNPAKLSDPLIEEWSKVLRETAGSKLLLKNTQFEGEEFRQKTRDRFASFGIEEDRLILDGPEKHSEFLKAYHRIDIALDTWPYSGGLTTCEALMMGVPVVTCTGPTFAGRHSATHLSNAGLHELVTDNWEDFHRRVKELASDIESLATIRSALRTIVKDSPLCDGKLFADHFTTAMRAIWQRHCEGKAPEALTMDKEGHAQFEDEDGSVILETLRDSQEEVTDCSLDEPIIVVDNGALMPKHPHFIELMQSCNFAVMSFDPGSQYTKQADQLKAFGEWHHHPHALLGDGNQKTLYVTLNPEKTGTLKPLSPELLPEHLRQDLQLLTELPIDSLRLDDIEGLPGVDMLLLDGFNNALNILESGKKYLRNCLVIYVKVPEIISHECQHSVYELNQWAIKNSFITYGLEGVENKTDKKEGVSFDASDFFMIHEAVFGGLDDVSSKKFESILKSFIGLSGFSEEKNALLNSHGYVRYESLKTFQDISGSTIYQAESANNFIYLKYPLIYGVELFEQGVLLGQERTGLKLKVIEKHAEIIKQVIEASPDDVIFTGHSFYNLSIKSPPYIMNDVNIFDLYKKIPFSIVDDHAYADFMLSRCRKSPEKIVVGSSSELVLEEFEAVSISKNVHKIKAPLKVPAVDEVAFDEKEERAVFLGKLYPNIDKNLKKLIKRVREDGRLSSKERDSIFEMIRCRKNDPFYSPLSMLKDQKDIVLLYFDLVDKFFRNSHRELELGKISAAFSEKNIPFYIIGGVEEQWDFTGKKECIFFDKMAYSDAIHFLHNSKYIVNLTPSYPDSLPKRALDAMCSNSLCITDFTPFYDSLNKKEFYYDYSFVESNAFDELDISLLARRQKEYILQFCNEELVASQWAECIKKAHSLISN